MRDLNTWIENEIVEFTEQSHFNTLNNNTALKAWDKPIIGVSSGDDSYFEYFKNIIGKKHWTPKEVFNIVFPADKVSAKDLRVITWILPKSQLVKKKNARQIRIPSEELEITLKPVLPDQELLLSIIYWEGAVRITGNYQQSEITGFGYVELTGYAEPMDETF